MFDRDESTAEPTAVSAPAYLGELLNQSVPFAPDDLQHAFNHNQIASKSWLLDALFGTLGGRFGTVAVLGGWYGVLGAMLLGDDRFDIDRVLSFDIDPNCARVAAALNRKHAAEGRFEAVMADVCELDYAGLSKHSNGRAAAPGAAGNGTEIADLVINTSCEHMTPTRAWYSRVPRAMPQVLQSNDYFDCPDHVNCMADLEAFKADVPMAELVYQGALERKRYTRFMLIGRK